MKKNFQQHKSLKKMQIKLLRPIITVTLRRVKIKITDKQVCWRGCEASGSYIYCWWEDKMVLLPRKTVCQLPIILSILTMRPRN